MNVTSDARAKRGEVREAKQADQAERDEQAALVAHLQVLGEAAGDDIVAQLVTMFFEKSGPANLEKLRTALQEGDAAKVVGTAHMFYGTSANLGAKRVARLCRELENAAQRGGDERARLEELVELVGELEGAVNAAREGFREALAVLEKTPSAG
jgi:histidine phosphotransfer protein HptB